MTRYLKTVRSVPPVDVALLQLPTEALLELFAFKGVEGATTMQLFLLKRMQHPDWQQHWQEASMQGRWEADEIAKLFDPFIDSFLELHHCGDVQYWGHLEEERQNEKECEVEEVLDPETEGDLVDEYDRYQDYDQNEPDEDDS